MKISEVFLGCAENISPHLIYERHGEGAGRVTNILIASREFVSRVQSSGVVVYGYFILMHLGKA